MKTQDLRYFKRFYRPFAKLSSSIERKAEMKPFIKDLMANPLLRIIFDAVNCGLVVVDEDRRVVALNDVMQRTLGVSRETTLGKRVGEVLGCVHLTGHESHKACCESTNCENCEIRKAAIHAISTNSKYATNAVVSVTVKDKIYDLSFRLKAFPFDHQNKKYAVVFIENLAKFKSVKLQHGRVVGLESIIGEHETIKELKRTVLEVAQYDFPVLIQGESGTGKELVAMAIHSESQRTHNLFVPVNCAALPHGLLESELFGHTKGAFTGALRDKKGRFELANGGTIFLDEIGDLDLSLQVKLLRVLQEGSFEKVGSIDTHHVDVRVISATNRDLQDEVRRKKFRLDLFYRLCVAPITIPPLRERTSDIPLLANHFVNLFMADHVVKTPKISKKVIDILIRHNWPGNIRELQNVIQFSLMKSKGKKIGVQHLPSYIIDESSKTTSKRRRKLTRTMVDEALQKAKGNKLKAAKLLGVSRSTLYRFFDEMKENR